MTAPTLFDPVQPVELARVSGVIATAILEFFRMRRIKGLHEFHADELHNWVAGHIISSTAPASADRILRELRRVGKVQYVVVNRRQSLYRLF